MSKMPFLKFYSLLRKKLGLPNIHSTHYYPSFGSPDPTIIIYIGAKLAVAPVAHATPLFLPRPEIIYINVLHFSAPPRTYLVSATPLFRPLWRH